MLQVWSTCVIFLSLLFVVDSAPSRDVSSIDQLEQFIFSVNKFTDDNELSVRSLPDVNLLTIVKAVNGRLSNFSTFELRREPFLNKTQTPDGFTTYFFNVTVGLQNLLIQYDMILDLKLFSKKGHFGVSVGQNSLELVGQLTYNDQDFCKAAILDLKLLEYGDFKIVQPYGKSFISSVTEAIMNFSSSLMKSIANEINPLYLLVSSDLSNAFSKTICDTFPR